VPGETWTGFNKALQRGHRGLPAGGSLAKLVDRHRRHEATRAGIRRQARDWLRAELEARRRVLVQEPARPHVTVADDLQRWLWDTPFAGVRGPDALGRLPVGERQDWQRLWANVADTLARAQGTMPPEQQGGGKVQRPER
jgi:hypothetical protein